MQRFLNSVVMLFKKSFITNSMYLLTFNLHKANGVKSNVCTEVPCKSDLKSRHKCYSDKSPGRAALFLFMLFWHCFYSNVLGSYCEISEQWNGNFQQWLATFLVKLLPDLELTLSQSLI